jgi:hypothetical protein
MAQFPSIDGASGIWSLKKQKRAQQGVNWPLNFPWPGSPISPGSTPYGMISSYRGPALYTTDSGTSWQTLYGDSSSYSYGGISSGNSFLSTTAPFRHYDKTFSSYQENTNFQATIERVYKNPDTGSIVLWNGSNALLRSLNNGATFSTVYTRSPSGSFSSGLHYGNGLWFHTWVDTNVTPRVPYYVVSTNDGASWTSSGISGLPTTSAAGFSGFSCYMNGKHHAWLPGPVGSTPTRLYTSTDGFTWTYIGQVSDANIGDNYGQSFSVFFRSPYYYAKLGSSDTRIGRSTDGYTFTAWGVAPSPSDVNFYNSPAYINGFWIAGSTTVSPNYQIKVFQSSDPTVGWTLRYTGSTNSYGGQAMGINQNNPN